MRDRVNKLLSLIFALSIVVLTITFSIGLPIYVRPFYYAHVDALGMAERWGVKREQIIEAYDELLDFLTVDGKEFGVGFLAYSEEGKGHFEDCKVLFDLNRNAFIVSLVLLVGIFILHKRGIIELKRPYGNPLSFYSGIGTLSFFTILGISVMVDFVATFTVFHKIFFSGKTNWKFNPYKDPIILLLPRQFFMNCAILICSSIVIISLLLIIRGIRLNKHNKKENRQNDHEG